MTLLFTYLLERALKNCRVKSKIRANSNKFVLVQVLLKFDIVILNNNFVFCMMSSFLFFRKGNNEVHKRVVPHMFKKVLKKLDKHLRRSLFYESWAIIHHSLLKMNNTLLETWGKWWLKYEKIKTLRKIWRNSCFKLKQINYIKLII